MGGEREGMIEIGRENERDDRKLEREMERESESWREREGPGERQEEQVS